jgi:predicted transcriptional regulator
MTNDTQKMIDALKTQLASIERQLAASKSATRDGATVKLELLSALKQSGHMSVADLIAACKLPKSTGWLRVNELEREGKIWLRVTHRKDGRKVTLAYHADAIAT